MSQELHPLAQHEPGDGAVTRCAWCSALLAKGFNCLQPWAGVWVCPKCDHWAWHEATPEELGSYLDKVRPS